MWRQRLAKFFLALVVSFVGAVSTVSARAVLSIEFPWKNGLTLQFRKPVFESLLSYLIPCVFVIPCIIACRFRGRVLPCAQYVKMCQRTAFPAMLSALATVVDFYTLVYMPAVVWQTFQSWKIVFSGVISVACKHQGLHVVEWLGLFIIVVGVSCCGVSSLLRSIVEDPALTSSMFFSFILLIFGCAVRSVAAGMEVYLLKEMDMTAVQLTAFEGVWGFCYIGLLLLPILQILDTDAPFYENVVEIGDFFERSSTLVLLEVAVIIAAGLAMYLMMITIKQTDKNPFSYEVFKPFFVALISFLVGKWPYAEGVGEPFDKFSPGDIIGVVIVVVGVCFFEKIMRCPCCKHREHSATSGLRLIA